LLIKARAQLRSGALSAAKVHLCCRALLSTGILHRNPTTLACLATRRPSPGSGWSARLPHACKPVVHPSNSVGKPTATNCQPQNPHLDQDGAKGYRMACPITSHHTKSPLTDPLTWIRMERKACTRSGVEGRKGVPGYSLYTMRLTLQLRGREEEGANSIQRGCSCRQGEGLHQHPGQTRGAAPHRAAAGSKQCDSSTKTKHTGNACDCGFAGRPSAHRMFFTSSSSRRASSSVSFTSLQNERMNTRGRRMGGQGWESTQRKCAGRL